MCQDKVSENNYVILGEILVKYYLKLEILNEVMNRFDCIKV